uniref:Uncharacterized protein n=1 Tax=Timema shepardi TaxID=629360 RepID=A0A7R9G6D0_TIMSH|nr:unnamed protein product [Timema shepardi]
MLVEPWFLEHFSPADEPDKDGLYSRALGLRFQLDKRHFNNPLELKCSATVGGRTWDRVISPGLATLTNQKLAQERLANHASGVDQTWVICCLVIASLLGVLKS